MAQLEAELQQLRAENARADQMLRSIVDYAVITLDAEGCITGWSGGAQGVFGYTEAEVLGRSGNIVFTSEDRDAGAFTVELSRAMEHGRATNERWHVRRDGTRFWASGLMMPMLDEEGQPNGFLNILRDRTELRAQAERREVLMAEMNHRVKNTFAVVQAIAAQSIRHATTMTDFQSAFHSRLSALARSHDMLIKGGWEDAPLRDVIEGALGGFWAEPRRITIEGPSVLLPANMVTLFTLVFHELGTNAAKHGALSLPTGSVRIVWSIKPGTKGCSHVELVWAERGGPEVSPPEREGFGSQLLRHGLRQFGSSLRLEFHRAGLECHVCFPIGTGASDGAHERGR